ncbi:MULTISPECIES: hypothetical protein [unclassified Pseudofrankia]|uniref:hypothetical protein n=1 Tax=unclassified Pseudofrankia TaxID=2994372 RepID=UPI0008DA1F27|nr:MULTISPECIES: hypothetical protein [unclassified Pseudofrankia]MDT3439671.1 hypothetical protein [Pseudofrankia sp. BMG5.37]OHV42812.1 hypothetical protein BCD48_29750 [Pseudofrankia sp. BMG5.36]
MARHRVDSRTAPRVASAAPHRRSDGRHAARAAAKATSRAVVARRIALPAVTVAVASVITIGGAVAFATSPRDAAEPVIRAATTAPVGTAPTGAASPDGALAGTTPPEGEAAAVGASAGAARSAVAGAVTPSPADAGAITAAIRSSDLTGLVSPASYQVVDIEIAGSDPSWARAELMPVTADVDRARGVLHRTESGWRLVQLGSYEVGCTLVPSQARADLALDCPPPTATTYST